MLVGSLRPFCLPRASARADFFITPNAYRANAPASTPHMTAAPACPSSHSRAYTAMAVRAGPRKKMCKQYLTNLDKVKITGISLT